MKTIDRSRLQELMRREQKKFVEERPKSKALFERARKSLLAGVPMNCERAVAIKIESVNERLGLGVCATDE